MKTHSSPVQADSEIQRLLAQLDTNLPAEGAAGCSPDSRGEPCSRTDQLLSHIVWSRLAEPGDHAAGALISTLGAVEALRLVTTGASTKNILLALRSQDETLEADPRAVTAGLKRWLPRLDRAATLEDLKRSVDERITVVVPHDALWPEGFDDLGTHSPIALWVRGDPRHLKLQSLAIVGARAATSYGTHVTAEIADGVGSAGLGIVSGAAYGIDAVAHRTALALGTSTVAVLAGGVNRPYPASHRQLIDRIAANGAVCSEMVPGSAPTRWRFLQRNRLIAALAGATLITEAGTRSGSLNTAGHTAELGRSLGAVPGPVTSAASAGCHKLLREYGATLVTNTTEALELVGVGPYSVLQATSQPSDQEASRQPSLHQRLVDALPLRGTRTLAEAAKRAGVHLDEARGAMAELDLLGSVTRHETPTSGEVTWSLNR